MKKLMFSALIIVFSLVFIKTEPTSAAAYVGSGSASVKAHSNISSSFDQRVFRLENYLSKHNSPLSGFSPEFVRYADQYGLDWRLVAAISGVESTFGKRIPQNSYNAYGWANGNYYFESWEDSIEHVSKVLKEKYVDDGLISVDQIARRYAPPSSSWAWKVKYFMEEIDPMPLEFTI